MLDKKTPAIRGDGDAVLKAGYSRASSKRETELIYVPTRSGFDIFDVLRHYLSDNRTIIPATAPGFAGAFHKRHGKRKVPEAKKTGGRMRIMFADPSIEDGPATEDHIRVRQSVSANKIEQTVKEGRTIMHRGSAIHERTEYTAVVDRIGVNPYAVSINGRLREYLLDSRHRAVQVCVSSRVAVPFMVKDSGDVFKVEAEFYDAVGPNHFHAHGSKVEIEAIMAPERLDKRLDAMAAQDAYLRNLGMPLVSQDHSVFAQGLDRLRDDLRTRPGLSESFNALAPDALWRRPELLRRDAYRRLGKEAMLQIDFLAEYKL